MPTYIPCKHCGSPNLISDTICFNCGVKLKKDNVDTKFLNERLNDVSEFMSKISPIQKRITQKAKIPSDVMPNTVFKAQSRYDLIRYLWFLLGVNKKIKIVLKSDGNPKLKDLENLFHYILPTKVSTQLTDKGLELQLSEVDKTDKTLILKIYKHGHWKMYAYFVDLVGQTSQT